MADIKQVQVDGITYNIKDEEAREQLATKQPIIESVSSTYEENGGSPSAVASTDENGNLAFNFQNLKLKFSDLTADDKEAIRGPQGASAVFDPETGNILATLHNTTGQDDANAMTQKAVTDAILDSITLKAKQLSIYDETLNPDGEITKANYNIVRSTGKFNTNNGKKHGVLPVKPGEKYIFRSLIDPENTDEFDDYCCYAFATSASFTSGGTVPIVEDTSIGTVAPSEYTVITIPEGCSYLLLSNDAKATTTVAFIVKWEIWRTYDDEDLDRLEQKFNEETEDITQQIEGLTNMRYYDFDGTDTMKFPPGPYVQSNGTFGGANDNYASYHFSKDVSITMRGKHLRLTPQAGSLVRCAFLITNEPKAKRTVYYSAYRSGHITGDIDEVLDLVVPMDTEYVLFQQIRSKADIRPARIEVYEKATLEDVRKFAESIAQGISSDTNSTKSIVRQAVWVADDMTDRKHPLALLHFSDIHGTDESAQKILQYIEQYDGYIDDVLCTGDSADYLSDEGRGKDWWVGYSGLAEKSLFVIGNHDGATDDTTEFDKDENGYAWDGQGQQWDYDNYFAPFIEGWGVTMPDGYDDPNSPYYKACYWHKDYPEQKVRLIGLDCMHRFDGVVMPSDGTIVPYLVNPGQDLILDGEGNPVTEEPSVNYFSGAGVKHTTNEQELWLIEKLNETLDPESDVYEWSVIVCCHYALDDMTGDNEQWDEQTHKWVYNQNTEGGIVMSCKTSSVANFHYGGIKSVEHKKLFNLRNRIPSDNPNTTYGYNKGRHNNFGNIISEWINRSGKFIAWLSGHSHRDYMYYPTNFPNMLNITIDQAGNLNTWNSGDRTTGTENATCANFFVADTQNGLIKIVRLGFTMNKYLNSHQYICYDYINKKVISEG